MFAMGPGFFQQIISGGTGIAFKNSGTTGGNATTPSITLPTGSVAGDFALVIIAGDDNNADHAPPTGWTSVSGFTNTTTADGEDNYLIWKFLSSTDISNGSITWPSAWGANWGMSISTFTGVNATPINAVSHNNQNTAQSSPVSVVAPTITTTVNGCMIVAASWMDIISGSSGIGTVFTAPSGYTNGVTYAGVDFAQVFSASTIQSTSGVIAAQTTIATLAGAQYGWCGALVALAPA